MIKQRHLIAQQVLELTTASQQHAPALQRELSALYQDELLPLINEVFDEAVGPHECLRINRLEIDLGHITDTNYETLKDRLRKKLGEALRHQAAQSFYDYGQQERGLAGREVSTKPVAQSDMELLAAFITTGRLPWWASSAESTSIAQLAAKLIDSQPDRFRVALIRLLETDTYAERIIHQLPDAVLIASLRLLNPDLAAAAANIHRNLMAMHGTDQLLPLSKSAFRLVLWRSAFRHAIHHNPYALNARATKRIASQQMQGQQSTAHNYASELLNVMLEKLDETSNRKELLVAWVTRALTARKRSPYLVDKKYLKSKLKNWKTQPTQTSRSVASIVSAQANIQQSVRDSPVEHRESFPEDEAIAVSNAGIVLLSPFLPAFFEGLGLVESKAFATDDAAARAALVLQYLVTKDTVMPEHDLVLNKILCGLDISIPLPAALDLTATEIDECEHLLNVVAARWDALKGTSGEGLRQTFFRRDGIIRHQNQSWKLTVAQRHCRCAGRQVALDDLDHTAPMEQTNVICRMVDRINHNATDIGLELEWLKKILRTRSAINGKEKVDFASVLEIPPPHFNGSPSGYAAFVKQHNLTPEDRFLLILAAVPHIKPELLDMFLSRNNATQQVYTEFGGYKGKHHGGFIPTGETVMFILAGTDLEKRFQLNRIFDRDHFLIREHIIKLSEVDMDESYLSGALTISRDVLDLFTTGLSRKPTFSYEFPAQLLTTRMEWSDLVLNR
ncbi:MAG: hypothetical protein HC859_12250, partial [Bacteroidia bacterium]|nr:hypothetical protein [Bacteroidia bacterium]